MTRPGLTQRSTTYRRLLTVAVMSCALAACLWAAGASAPTRAGAWAPPTSTTTIPAEFAPADTDLPAAPKISAQAAILLDPEGDRILYSRKANNRLPMASTTKIMTALVVLDRLPLDMEVTASLKASETIGSGMELKEGETYTVEQLLNALLIHSANDAAVALAEATDGSVEAFADSMNAKARELGLKNSRFVNPHGMNAKGHYSSALDLALMAAAGLSDPIFRSIVDTWTYVLPRDDGTVSTFTNRNKLLEREGWVNGVKTGSTPRAGQCLVASGSKDGRTLISVVLGEEGNDPCWNDSLALLKYGFEHYRRVVVATRGQQVSTLTLPFPRGATLGLMAEHTLALSVFAEDEVTTTVRAQSDVAGPVAVGEKLGSLTAKVNGGEVGSVELVAANAVEVPSLTDVVRRLTARWPPGLRLTTLALTPIR